VARESAAGSTTGKSLEIVKGRAEPATVPCHLDKVLEPLAVRDPVGAGEGGVRLRHVISLFRIWLAFAKNNIDFKLLTQCHFDFKYLKAIH
jgi:hypothetical protein